MVITNVELKALLGHQGASQKLLGLRIKESLSGLKLRD